MNFQEWYKNGPKLTESELRISVLAWDKCKEEVLKILKDNHVTVPDTLTEVKFTNDGKWYWAKVDIIEKIENL